MTIASTLHHIAGGREDGKDALTGDEAAVVEAAASRIFPTTDTPGAAEAGVIHYICRTLTEAYPKQIATYRDGCAALDQHARSLHGRPFARLGPEEQDAVLIDFDKGEVPTFTRAKSFFALLRKHTMEGMFGEPIYGGNRGLVGWRLVGFPGQQFGYPDPYIDRPIDIEPVAQDSAFPQEEALNAKRG